MRSLVSAPLAFALLVVAHVVVWRVRRPAGQYGALVVLSLASLAVALGSFFAIQSMSAPSVRFLPACAFDYFNVVMLYGALFLSYLTTYSAVQADSPTMAILLRIEEAGRRGLSLGEIVTDLNNRVLVVPRLNDLVTGNLVRLRRGRYVIGPRGTVLAEIHIFYRTLLKMEKGG